MQDDYQEAQRERGRERDQDKYCTYLFGHQRAVSETRFDLYEKRRKRDEMLIKWKGAGGSNRIIQRMDTLRLTRPRTCASNTILDTLEIHFFYSLVYDKCIWTVCLLLLGKKMVSWP